MTTTARLALALIFAAAIASACASQPTDGRLPSPTSTPIARPVSSADAPQGAATPPPGLSTLTEATPGAADSPTPDVSSSTTAELTPVVDVPSRVSPPSAPAQVVGGRGGVPILMYHYIRVNPVPTDRIGFGLSIPPADFEAQMAYLQAHGYRSVTVADVATGAAFKGSGRPVAITFDDGYDDAYAEAFPTLTRHGFHGTFYVVTEFVGRQHYMTWDQIRALAAAGNLIGSHTESHLDLTRLDAVTLYAQLAVSRQTLEAQLRQPVLDFCYPAGRFDPAVKAMVGRVGYRTATTENPGLARQGDDLLALPRVRVYGGVTLEEFAKLLEGIIPARPTRVPGSATRAPAS